MLALLLICPAVSVAEHTSIAEGSEEEEESSSDDGSSTSSQHGTAGVPEGLALALLSGDIQLPLAERINLPVEAVRARACGMPLPL